MSAVQPSGPRAGVRRRAILAVVALFVAVPAVNVLAESIAAAAPPTLIQLAAGQGSNASPSSTVAITATLGSACAAGDTLIAMVTISQQNSAGGMVSAVPPGWQRLYEHSPVDTSPYQGWFALSNCGGTTSATFSVTAPGDSAGTTGSVVLDEFSGVPNPVALDFSQNDGSSSAVTTENLTGNPTPSGSGELTLSALSFPQTPPSQTTPSGWNLGGSETTTIPAYTYWQIGNGSAPTATYNWSPASNFEVTILALKAGPASAPNVVQENQNDFSGTLGSATLSNGVSAGDSLVALIGTNVSGVNGNGFEATSLIGGGVTWQQVAGYRQNGNGSSEVWVGFGSTGTSGPTPVNVTMAMSLNVEMVVSEVSGIASVDASSVNHGNSANPTANSINPQAGDLLVGLATANTTSLVTHPQPTWSTYSLSSPTYGAEWQSNVPNGSSTPQWSTSSSSNWTAVQAAFIAGVPPPVVTSVSPASGAVNGGTSVTISGSSFTGATAVDFGATVATGFTVNSATSITATSPAGSLGTVDVTVTGPGGTSATSSNDSFTYVAVPSPVVTGLSPSFGSGKGGSTVTVTGTNLLNATRVAFGSASGVIQSVNPGGSSLVATTPAGTGTVDVTVTTPGGTSATTAADRYTYQGYWMVGSDGGVFAFGDAGFVGSLPGLGVHVNNVVGVVATKTSKGYWMVGSDGGVFAFGDAGFVGSLPGLHVHVSDVVGVVPTSTGKGYWMVGSDGGVFAFGDAGFVGSLPGIGVHVSDIVGVVPTSTGKGYWMVGKDGGVFAFGDAGFVGSLPGLHVHVSDVVGVVPTSTGKGYWMVGSDGGVFAFGDAGFVGSLPGDGVHVSNVVAVVPTKDSKGYWMVGSDGGAFAFGDAGFVGSLPGLGVHVSNVVGVVPT